MQIYLIDDHQIVNDGLKNLLDKYAYKYQVSAVFNNAADLLQKLKFEQPNLIISDISMPEMNGIELAKIVLKEYPTIKWMFLTMHKQAEYVLPAMAAGVHGYVLKDAKLDELLEAIDTVMQNQLYYSAKVSGTLINGLKNKIELTPRETEVLKGIVKGKTSKDIAMDLNLSHHTVESHRKTLFAKTDSNNIAELIVWAIKEGLIEISKNP